MKKSVNSEAAKRKLLADQVSKVYLLSRVSEPINTGDFLKASFQRSPGEGNSHVLEIEDVQQKAG